MAVSVNSRTYSQSYTMILTQVLLLSTCLVIITITPTAEAVTNDAQTRKHPVPSTVSSVIVDRTKLWPRSRQEKKHQSVNEQRLTPLGHQASQLNETGRYPLRLAPSDTIQSESDAYGTVTKVADGWSSLTTVLANEASMVDTTIATDASEKSHPHSIVVAISVISKSNRTTEKELFDSTSPVTGVSRARLSRKPLPQLSVKGMRDNVTSTTVGQTSSTVTHHPALSSQDRIIWQPQSTSNIFDSNFERGEIKPDTVKVDNHLSSVVRADTNLVSSDWYIDTGSSPSPTEVAAPSSSLFPLVAPDDVASGADSEWETVNELLREVGHQLSGLRSFIRRVRADNAAVYRDIMQTVLRINRANSDRAGMLRCAVEDDDQDEDNGDDDGEDEKDDFRKEPIASQLPTSVHHQLTGGDDDVTKKRFSVETVEAVEAHRHRHGHGMVKLGDVIVRNRCPAGFERVSASSSSATCFRLFTERVTWTTARERCSSIGAHLATIRSAAEQRHLAELARKKYETMHCDFWIGLTRKRNLVQLPHGSRHSNYRQSSDVERHGDRHRTRSGRHRHRLFSHVLISEPHRRRHQRSGWHWIADTPDSPVNSQVSSSLSETTLNYVNWNEGEPNDAGSRRRDQGGVEQCVEALWVFGWKWNDAHCDGPATACYACQTTEL